jgi:multicomponent Na+:H+ antiporter subunit D
MPFTFAAFLLASLSIIGLPPLTGSWSKLFLIDGALTASSWLAVFAYFISTLLAIAYLGPVLIRGYTSAENATIDHASFSERPLLCIASLTTTASLTLILFFIFPWIYRYVETIPL